MTRVGLIQLRTPATHTEALAHVASRVRQAADQGARLVVTPEGTNLLQRDRAKLAGEIVSMQDDPVVQGLAVVAAELEIEVLVGSALVRREDGGYANRSVLIGSDGAIHATYDKIHMFDVDLPTGERHRESSVYVPGDRAVVAETAAGRFGLTICYDIRFPGLYRALARAGAIAMTVPAAFTRPTGEAHWETLLRARAIETGGYVLAPAQGGVHADGRATWGRSMAIDPWGAVVARLDHDEPGVLIVDIEPARAIAAREAIPALRNERDYAPPSPSLLGEPPAFVDAPVLTRVKA